MAVSDGIDPHACKGFLLTQAVDTKRPVTARLPNQLNLTALARHLGIWGNPTAKQLAAKQAQQTPRLGQPALL